MATTIVNPTKWAKITGQATSGVGGFTTARTTAGSVLNNPTSDNDTAIYYSALSGRGSTTYYFNRSYYYFDLSSTPDLTNLTTASLDINGVSFAESKVVIVSSSAFGGDGSSNATTGEFYTSLDYSQPYTDTNGQQWNIGANSFDLDTADVLTYLKSNPDAFTFAIIDYTHDYGNTSGTPNIIKREGIKFSDHASSVELTLITPAATSNIDNINGVAYNASNRFNGVLLSGIGNINGVS